MGLSHKYHVGLPVPLPKGHPPHLILQDLHDIRRQRCLQTIKWCADEEKGPCLPCSSAVKASEGQFAVSSVVCKQVHNMFTCVCARVCARMHACVCDRRLLEAMPWNLKVRGDFKIILRAKKILMCQKE